MNSRSPCNTDIKGQRVEQTNKQIFRLTSGYCEDYWRLSERMPWVSTFIEHKCKL